MKKKYSNVMIKISFYVQNDVLMVSDVIGYDIFEEG